MAQDDLFTRSVAVSSATTSYPTGHKAYGDAGNFDELEIYHIPYKGGPMFMEVYVPAYNATSDTLDITFEVDDNIAFSSAQTVATMKQITGTACLARSGTANVGAVFQGPGMAGIQELYGRFKLVSTGGSCNFGTVVCTLTPYPNSRYSYI